jgi:hypothetical protein
MKTKFEQFIDTIKSTPEVPDELPIALLLTPSDMEKMNVEPSAGKNTGNIGGLPFIIVPLLKNSFTLYASGKTSKLEL